MHRRRKRGVLGGLLLLTVGARMRRVTVVVCLVLEHLLVLKMLSYTQRATEVKRFVEVSLKRLRCRDPTLPPLKFSCGKRACALCPNSTYVAPRVLHFSASYILRATLAREPIFWGGLQPQSPPLPPPMTCARLLCRLSLAEPRLLGGRRRPGELPIRHLFSLQEFLQTNQIAGFSYVTYAPPTPFLLSLTPVCATDPRCSQCSQGSTVLYGPNA